jgi:coenzyme F420 biosynthesis associated uncharacterized protein
MIDWTLAARVAATIAAHPPTTDTSPLAGDLPALARRSEELVVAYTRLQPSGPLPPPEEVDRETWIDANLTTMRSTLAPMVELVGAGLGPLSGPLRATGGVVIGAEVGVLTGYLGQRVLGQYDLALLDPGRAPRLLFVAPNIRDAARSLGADEEELLAWIAFHEITHAVQFGAVPWLAGYIAGLLEQMLSGLDVAISPASLLRLPSLDDLRGLIDAVRSGGLVAAVTGADRRVVLDRVQAVMAMVEGHAEHVMDAVGVHELESIERLRARLDERRRERPPLARLLEWLLGFELKLRQYDVGRGFCDAVVAAEGIDGLNRAWTAPEFLPTTAELADANAWMARMRAAA